MSELGYTQQELDNAEARKIGYLMDLAAAKQASWINDVSLAIYHGKGTVERVRSLQEGLISRFEEKKDGFNLIRLKALAASGFIQPETAERMLEQIQYIESGKAAEDAAKVKKKREEYLAFCKSVGMEP